MLVEHQGEIIQSVIKNIDPLADALEQMSMEDYALLLIAMERKKREERR